MFPLFLTAQDSYPLTISSGNSLSLSQGATLNVVGMELTPDADYTLSGFSFSIMLAPATGIPLESSTTP